MKKYSVKELKIDHKEKKIIMNCSFAKRQSNTDSIEYKKLQDVHREFPDYEIVTKSIKKKENKEAYKGLTYDYMERYISMRGAETDMEEYKNMRLLSECHRCRYPAIKQWFLGKYTEVACYGVIEDLIDTSAAVA